MPNTVVDMEPEVEYQLVRLCSTMSGENSEAALANGIRRTIVVLNTMIKTRNLGG